MIISYLLWKRIFLIIKERTIHTDTKNEYDFIFHKEVTTFLIYRVYIMLSLYFPTSYINTTNRNKSDAVAVILSTL